MTNLIFKPIRSVLKSLCLLAFINLYSVLNLFSNDTILVINDCEFFINNDAIIYVKEASVKNSSTNFFNYGNFIVKGGIRNMNGVMRGNGTYNIEGNWRNDGQFIAGTNNESKVILDGKSDLNNQYITGDFKTEFYDLELAGSGLYKTLEIDASVKNKLFLNDKILNTDSFTLFVVNPDVNAILRYNTVEPKGMVVSKNGGALGRVMNKKDEYIFPVGSVKGISRYRPLVISPSTSITNEYLVRFINNNPSDDGFYITNDTINFLDTTACYANHRFYHEVLRTKGDDSVKITINFDSIIDANWDGIATWLDYDTSWFNLGDPIAGVNTDFKSIAKGNIKVNKDPFIRNYFVLIARRPSPALLNGPTRICDGEPNELTYFTFGDPTNKHHWHIYGGEIISGDSSAHELVIKWENYVGEKNITIKELSKLPNCASFASAYRVNIYPKPIADFVVTRDSKKPVNNDAAYFEIDSTTVLSYDLLQFVNLSPDSNSNYFWDFSDGGSSAKKNPYHAFNGVGNYKVMLLANNEYGCSDTAFTYIDVVEGLYFPNVFTPNGDGFNDVFALRGSGMKSFVLSIYNRWGVLMYETVNPYEGWDGKTIAGLMAPAGVYYYILNAKSLSQDYKFTGFVTLIR